MKRAHRLRRPDQFRRVRREGRLSSSPLLNLSVVVSRRHRVRCGFVVTRQFGGAVERNRAKRRVREVVRLLLPSISPGYDLVIVVRSTEILKMPFSELSQLVEQLLRRSGVWRQSSPNRLSPPNVEPSGAEG
jgi:ribonuclease P protein component